jgi:hypothetical protein
MCKLHSKLFFLFNKNYTFEWFRVNATSTGKNKQSDNLVNVPSNFQALNNVLKVTNFMSHDWAMYVCAATDQNQGKKYISMVLHEGSNEKTS